MKLQIITPDKGIEIDKEVCLVEAEGEDGHFGVVNGHIPFIATLKDKAVVRYQTKPTNPFQQISLTEGVLEVSNEKNQTSIKVIASQISK